MCLLSLHVPGSRLGTCIQNGNLRCVRACGRQLGTLPPWDTGRVAPGPTNPHQPTKKPARVKVNSGARSMDAATPKRCPMRPPAPINGCAPGSTAGPCSTISVPSLSDSRPNVPRQTGTAAPATMAQTSASSLRYRTTRADRRRRRRPRTSPSTRCRRWRSASDRRARPAAVPQPEPRPAARGARRGRIASSTTAHRVSTHDQLRIVSHSVAPSGLLDTGSGVDTVPPEHARHG